VRACRKWLRDGAPTICDMRVPVSATGRRGEAAQRLKRLEGVADPIPLHERRSEDRASMPPSLHPSTSTAPSSGGPTAQPARGHPLVGELVGAVAGLPVIAAVHRDHLVALAKVINLGTHVGDATAVEVHDQEGISSAIYVIIERDAVVREGTPTSELAPYLTAGEVGTLDA
jgi:hypothetical protein